MIYVMSGGAKAFAVIGVTYPAGSVCTCSDGIKTLNLKDTGGQDFFLIPYAGTWTVTCTDGENEKSESVEITTERQSVSVELRYTPEGALYWYGDQVSAVTGGWLSKTKGTGTVTFNDSTVTVTCPVSQSAVMVTSNIINMTNYSYIELQLESRPETSGGYQFSVLSQNENVTSYDNMTVGTRAHVVVKPDTLDSNLSIKLDISAVNNGYVAFGGADSSAQTMVVKSIRMI